LEHAELGFTTAEKLGLPFVPPYLEQSMRMGVCGVGLSNIDGMIQGVNYASAAAGILSNSGSELVCSPLTSPNINLTIMFVVTCLKKSM
jgi:hypothetical protein